MLPSLATALEAADSAAWDDALERLIHAWQLADLAAFPHLEQVELTVHPDARAEAELLAATMKRFRVTLV